MEFIANLEQSQPTEGLTSENLKHLEKVFQDAVGDKKEIDLEQFKKIVQSKNMFFVERIFRIFDADNSGTVSMEEFMHIMRSFSLQTPQEKLKYLFEVYDLNGDGSIQFSELRNVISECMKENGLAFRDTEIDELAQMLFEDADTDDSGAITFEEFKDQLQRHPAFMENLTLSVEKWLLPPIKRNHHRRMLDSINQRKWKWQHIRNNWTSVTFLFLFGIVNLILFTSRAIEYRNSNGFVIVARACGQCLNFNCAFIVLLVLRQTLTWLRTHGFSQYFPIDQHLYYHKLTGFCILVYSIIHTIMHILNFMILSEELQVPLPQLLFSTQYNIGWIAGSACLTGWILLAVLIVMVVSAMPFVRRNGKFEIFYCLHLLSFAFWICLIVHGPSFWMWFLGPAVLFFMEIAIRVNRNLSSSKKAYVQQGILLPSKVTHLVIKRPPKFEYRPGDYVYINIPSIAKFEWHPFTISSAPELDDVIWLHVRGVGEWTNSLYRYFEREDKEAVLSEDLAKDLQVFLPDSSERNTTSMVNHHGSVHSCLSSSNHGTVNSNGPNTTYVVSPSESSETSCNETVIEMKVHQSRPKAASSDSSTSLPSISRTLSTKRQTSFSSTSVSRIIQKKNKQDIQMILSEHNKEVELGSMNSLRPPSVMGKYPKRKRRSVRVSVADRGLRRCQTIIVMPTVVEEDEEETKPVLDEHNLSNEEEMKDLKREAEVENVVVMQKPLKIFLDGPYGSPTRHIFHARHAVLIATGIGVTPFASILQSVMYQYRKSRHTCPNCNHKWSDPLPVSSIHLKKVDFVWLNRHQRSFEWFVSLLSELEIEQAQLKEKDRFLDIHMYITSALDKTDMKAVGLQMALDLLYKKEKRCLITGLKSRTQPGRPNWDEVFTSIKNQKKGKVTVFFCGPNELAKTLQRKCDEFGFKFRKEIF